MQPSPVVPGHRELPLPRPRVPLCGPANPPLRHGPCKKSWQGGCWQPLPPSSALLHPRGPLPRALGAYLLLPLFLTHFMTSRLRVVRLNTPLGRYGCFRGGGSMLGGLGFCSAISPLLGGGCLALQGQRPSPRGCMETLTSQSQRAAEGKAN